MDTAIATGKIAIPTRKIAIATRKIAIATRCIRIAPRPPFWEVSIVNGGDVIFETAASFSSVCLPLSGTSFARVRNEARRSFVHFVRF